MWKKIHFRVLNFGENSCFVKGRILVWVLCCVSLCSLFLGGGVVFFFFCLGVFCFVFCHSLRFWGVFF